MDDKWSRFQFSVGFCSQPNHGGYLSCFFPYLPTYLPTTCKLVVSRLLAAR
jgi:hypothetical protein